MNFRKRLMVSLTMLAALLLLPVCVLACACCADPGEYRISLDKPNTYVLGLLDRMRFGNAAHLYATEVGIEENAKGIVDPSENYAFTGSRESGVWKLTFREGKKYGTLILPLPSQMLSYRADIHDGTSNLNVTLYKEWRFEGLVNGTGFFRRGIARKTKYFLVFQGRGNNCDDDSNFTHWRLEITGPKAHYAFYGEMEKEPVVTKLAKGTFEVKLNPQTPEANVGDATIGRMSLEKELHGDLEGTSKGQMLAAMSDVKGSGAYVAIERVNGTLDGRKGTFALQHRGIMNRGAAELLVSVVPDSGTGELVGIEGTMTIEIVDGKHFYEFEYTIAKHD